MTAPYAVYEIGERKMDAILDTLAASRKLEESGMPEPQAGAVVEVVNDAMKDLVTKEFLTAELDRRFGKFESKMDRRFGAVDKEFAKVREDAAKSHKTLVSFMMGSTLAIIGMQLAVLSVVVYLQAGTNSDIQDLRDDIQTLRTEIVEGDRTPTPTPPTL